TVCKLPAGSRVAVYRNPSLHPGDVRVMTVAAESPMWDHLVDVAVFSAQVYGLVHSPPLVVPLTSLMTSFEEYEYHV
ncbi:hypothetical protein SARC_15648, partial [Sphaeroforma arctica JP610]